VRIDWRSGNEAGGLFQQPNQGRKPLIIYKQYKFLFKYADSKYIILYLEAVC